MGLISNAHRIERSTNFLIMEKRKYGAMLPTKTVWRLLVPCMREHRKTTEADLPSDCTQVALDSFRLKSTEDQGEIELRNIEAGVLQVLFGMLHLLVDSLNIFHYF